MIAEKDNSFLTVDGNMIEPQIGAGPVTYECDPNHGMIYLSYTTLGESATWRWTSSTSVPSIIGYLDTPLYNDLVDDSGRHVDMVICNVSGKTYSPSYDVYSPTSGTNCFANYEISAGRLSGCGSVSAVGRDNYTKHVQLELNYKSQGATIQSPWYSTILSSAYPTPSAFTRSIEVCVGQRYLTSGVVPNSATSANPYYNWDIDFAPDTMLRIHGRIDAYGNRKDTLTKFGDIRLSRGTAKHVTVSGSRYAYYYDKPYIEFEGVHSGEEWKLYGNTEVVESGQMRHYIQTHREPIRLSTVDRKRKIYYYVNDDLVAEYTRPTEVSAFNNIEPLPDFRLAKSYYGMSAYISEVYIGASDLTSDHHRHMYWPKHRINVNSGE